MTDELRPSCDNWMDCNHPMCLAYTGYLAGKLDGGSEERARLTALAHAMEKEGLLVGSENFENMANMVVRYGDLEGAVSDDGNTFVMRQRVEFADAREVLA